MRSGKTMAGNAALASTIAVSLVSNAGLYALVQSAMKFIERRRERKEDAAQRVTDLKEQREQRDRETRDQEEARVRAEEAETSRLWFSESRRNYETIKREASEAKRECAKCIDELRSTRDVMYRLLEDLEDQIIPMLMFDDAAPKEVRVAMRAAVRRAREAL
jgi:hypothetical protein